MRSRSVPINSFVPTTSSDRLPVIRFEPALNLVQLKSGNLPGITGKLSECL